jgi:16S rRNA (uracil1498-N3)-methyltransferase
LEHYYTPPENISDKTLTITNDEAKHLSKVLRKEPGADILVTDGVGNLYTCKIEEIINKEIICKIINRQKNVNESQIKLTAYISILKNPARFEFAIEKLTELGVHSIQPIITERVISKSKNKSFRWQLIALSAMKQSQRCFLPKVQSPLKFEKAVKDCKDETSFIAHEKVLSSSPLHAEGLEGEVSLFIGPEGGFTDEEINIAESNGFKVISLGKRKFRSETAAIAAASLILIR